MARSVERVGSQYGHKSDSLRLMSEYHDELRDRNRNLSVEIEKPSFSRTDYGN